MTGETQHTPCSKRAQTLSHREWQVREPTHPSEDVESAGTNGFSRGIQHVAVLLVLSWLTRSQLQCQCKSLEPRKVLSLIDVFITKQRRQPIQQLLQKHRPVDHLLDVHQTIHTQRLKQARRRADIVNNKFA